MPDYVADASYYRMTAVVYWENAKILEGAFRARGEKMEGNRMAVPFYFLISHALELFLKCALMKRGSSPQELKNIGLRHNLASLLRDIESKGVPISRSTRDLVRVMSDQHRSHTLRYTVFFENGGSIYTPKTVDLYSALDELMMAGRISTHGV